MGGALLRVTVLAGAGVFRVLVAAALLPLAATLFWRLARPASAAARTAELAPGQPVRTNGTAGDAADGQACPRWPDSPP